MKKVFVNQVGFLNDAQKKAVLNFEASSFAVISEAGDRAFEGKVEHFGTDEISGEDAFVADFYLMSSNAVTEQGDIVNVDGYGNRVAALSFGPRHVIIIIGRNKIVKDLSEAFERLRCIPSQTEFGTTMHVMAPCSSLGRCIDCKHKDRRCGIYSILRYQKNSQTQGKRRIVVVIVNEDLGC